MIRFRWVCFSSVHSIRRGLFFRSQTSIPFRILHSNNNLNLKTQHLTPSHDLTSILMNSADSKWPDFNKSVRWMNRHQLQLNIQLVCISTAFNNIIHKGQTSHPRNSVTLTPHFAKASLRHTSFQSKNTLLCKCVISPKNFLSLMRHFAKKALRHQKTSFL